MVSNNLQFNMLLGLDHEDKLIERIAEDLVFENYPDELRERLRPMLESWPMMSSLAPGLWCCLGYLLFVLWLGPLMMNRRKPYSLKAIMMAYNLAQVVFSCYLLYEIIGPKSRRDYVFQAIFYPQSHKIDILVEKELTTCSYLYLLSKYVELIDTVFFVLRKKQSQVTFLHVYHHTNMALSTWIFIKNIRITHTAFLAVLNLFVHAVMYSYYFLSALGPWIRPYLWWKKYITRIQLAQFVMVIFYVVMMILNGCPMQKMFIIYTLVNTSTFLFLFADFYNKAYSGAARKSAKSVRSD